MKCKQDERLTKDQAERLGYCDGCEYDSDCES